MNQLLIDKLSVITEEEKEILNGKNEVNEDLYYTQNARGEIDSHKVLTNGKIIDIRPHTRFIHFPKHTHNYVEFIYMVQGKSVHIIDEEEITLNAGDLLFLNQHATQEIYPTSREDIAVNFMILPQFFYETFPMLGNEDNALRTFIISCLTREDSASNYIYFNSSRNIPIQNLLENLIWNLLMDEPNKRSINQYTMGLLFINLINHSDEIRISTNSFEQNLTLKALSYIDNYYTEATLAEFARENQMDVYTISRIIKKQTGKTFKSLLENKRMSQACFLLKNTNLSIEEISYNIGYENLSFFYKLFRRLQGMSPREYRQTKDSAS